jgi:uncharacterized membrane protein YbhN (UPF0104 family)
VRRGRTLRVAVALVGLGIGAWVVLQRRDELAGASVIIEGLRWPWAAVALLAEAASFLCYAALGLQLLGAGGVTPGLPAMLGVTLAGNAIQNSLPGGVAFAGIYAFGQFRRFGADDVLAGWAMVGVAILSNVALAVVAVAGVAVAGGQGASLGLVEVIAVIAGVAVVVVVLFMRRGVSTARPLARALTSTIRWRQRLSGRPSGEPSQLARTALERVRLVAPRGGDWWASAALAIGNWAFDVLCLVGAFRAVNAELPWRGLLLAYGGAQLASALPFTPGGLGVVEGSLAIGLVAFGGAEEATVAAVLLYRLLSFWLALPVGWLAWAGIAWRNRSPKPEEMPA